MAPLISIAEDIYGTYKKLLYFPQNAQADLALSGIAFSCLGALATSWQLNYVRPAHFIFLGGLYYFCLENQETLLKKVEDLTEQLFTFRQFLQDRTELVLELAESNQQRKRIEILLTEVKALLETLASSPHPEIKDSLSAIQKILATSEERLLKHSDKLEDLTCFLRDLKESDVKQMAILLDIQAVIHRVDQKLTT